ncbi:MAG: hypothetical protein ACYSSP_04605 [Planctomycetota bacterium]|jgi:hypothetical protein
MLDKLLKLNIRILLSYLSAAIWTYYIGFGGGKFFGPDLLKLIFIIGIFIISLALSFWIVIIILPIKKPLVIKHRWLQILYITILSMSVLIALAHPFICAFFVDETIAIIVITGTLVFSTFMSLGIMAVMLPMRKLALFKSRWFRIPCTIFLSVFVLIALAHLFIWFVYKDVISLQVRDPYELQKIATVEKVKFYGAGGFLDSIDLYKFKAEPEAFEKIAKQLNFVEVDPESFEGSVLHFWNCPAYWWNPKLHKNIKLYKFINISHSSDSGVMLYDLNSNTAYMEKWDS